MLTNAPTSQLPTSTVLEVYAVRWQVELAFKLFKSDLLSDETKATEAQRVKCEFYAKLIALLLFNRLTSVAEHLLGEKVSPAKLFRRMRSDLDNLAAGIGTQYDGLNPPVATVSWQATSSLLCGSRNPRCCACTR